MDKSFFQSKKMVAAFICSIESTGVIIALAVASTMTQNITAEVLQTAMLTFGGSFGAAWSAAIGTQGWREARAVITPAAAPSAPPTPSTSSPGVAS